MENLLRQLTRESIRVIEFETDFAGENSFIGRLQSRNFIIQKFDALCQCGRETILLHADHTLDIVLFCEELAKILCITENLNNSIHRTVQEWLCYPKHAPMANCTTERTAQNISTSFIRRKNAIHNHDGDGARMVCNNLE